MNKKLFALSTLALLLAACNPSVILGGPGTIRGDVVTPGNFVLFSDTPEAATPVWQAPRRQGQVLIVKQSTFSAQSLGALSELGAQEVAPGVLRVQTPRNLGDEAFAAQLESQGFVVQPNYVYKTIGASTPNDPRRNEQYYLDRINIKEAWAALEDNKFNPAPAAVKIAVLDDGFDLNHPELVGRFVAGEPRDFCAAIGRDGCEGEDSNVSDDPGVVAIGHGTHTAGIVAANTNNGQGISGITWSGANLLPIKVFGKDSSNTYGADTVALTKGVNYAVSKGARVINMSLGIPLAAFENSTNPDPAFRTALEAAYQNKVVLVAAAGNTPNDGIYYPALESVVIAVGAVDKNNALTSFSARPKAGQKVDLVAPGVDILSLKPNNGFENRTGTSEASPQVAGVAALLIADRPNADSLSIGSSLRNGVTKIPGSDTNGALGAGLLNAKGALDDLRKPPVGGGGGQPEQIRRYPVLVEALNPQGRVVARDNRIITSGQNRVPYSLTLNAGQYTVRATIYKQQVAKGSKLVNLNAGQTQTVNIDTND
jgi:subtilisin family serine protease